MNVFITGASSGIGAAIAEECAKRGDSLYLCGRNRSRLDSVANRCRELGASSVADFVLDVTDADAVNQWFNVSTVAIDRVFVNAGVSTGQETETNERITFAINVNGTFNTVWAAINHDARQIAITASIAGYGPLKSCPAYSATKACIKTWGLALRGMLAPRGIKISVICPGFIRSRMTEHNTCPMPFLMNADKAARKILKGLDHNRGLIAFPWPMRFATWLLSILPYRFNELINSLLPKKII